MRAIILTAILMPVQADLKAQDFGIRGRLHLDALYGISDADQFSNGFNNRRARMGMSGTVTEGWHGQIEIDFADGGISPNDLRLRRSFANGGRLFIGQFKVPQGLNELTSSNRITFLERSTPSNLVTDARRLGIAYDYFGDNYGFKTMVFGRALGQRGSLVDDMPIGVAFRTVFFPEVGGGILHLGASVVYENLMDNNSVTFRDRPEARDSKGGSVRLIGVTIPDAESTFKGGAEFLFINGPFSVEAEYLMAAVQRSEGDNPAFSGWHVQASYVLTGESRAYSNGVPGTVSPSGDRGAWELAARFSFADLNDSGFTGGEQKNLTIGLNRYVTSRLRFMGNLIVVNVDNIDESPILGTVRAQFNF